MKIHAKGFILVLIFLNFNLYMQVAPCNPVAEGTLADVKGKEPKNNIETSDSPYIHVLTPVEGFYYRRNTNLGITWDSFGCSDSHVWINLSIIGTPPGKPIRIIDSTLNDGDYSIWFVPWDLEESSSYSIIVGSTIHSEQYGVSGHFHIRNKQTTTITKPAVGEAVILNETYTIKFSFINYFRYVDIDLYKGGILQNNLVTNLYTTTSTWGQYNWDVPEDLTLGDDYTIKVTEHADGVDYGFSQPFSITDEPSAKEEDDDDDDDTKEGDVLEIAPETVATVGVVIGGGVGLTALAVVFRKKRRIVPESL